MEKLIGNAKQHEDHQASKEDEQIHCSDSFLSWPPGRRNIDEFDGPGLSPRSRNIRIPQTGATA